MALVSQGLLCVYFHTHIHISCSCDLSCSHTYLLIYTLTCTFILTHAHTIHTHSCTHTHMLVHTPVLTHACSRVHSFASIFTLIHAHSPIACSKWVYSHAVYIHVLTHLYVCSCACPVHPCTHPPTTTVWCLGCMCQRYILPAGS